MTIKKEISEKINKKISIDWVANNNGTDFFQKVGLCEHIFYNRNKEEIWEIINNQGGLIDFLKHDNDTQYIDDHDSFKSVLSWLSVEYVAQKIRDKQKGINENIQIHR